MEFNNEELSKFKDELNKLRLELNEVKTILNSKSNKIEREKNIQRIDHQIGVGDIEITEKEKEYVADVLNSRRLSHGKYLSKFESLFAKAHNSKYALVCSSGTDALRISLACLKETENWKDADEIIVPAITFIATSNVILQNNMKPVFVDIEKDYYGIDPLLIERYITPRTRAIMPVHLFGMPCDMDPILAIAKKYNLKVIEDSCETMFARYKGNYVGTLGDLGCFSTYACHLIVTGVGGIITTNNPKYAEIVKSIMNHGRDSIYLKIDDDKTDDKKQLFDIVARRFKFERLGHSSRLTELEGALGVAQLERKEDIINKRRENANYFTSHLSKFSNYLQLPRIRPNTEHSFMMYPIVVKSHLSKQEIVNFLEENNIETRDMLPLLNQPIYKKIFGNLEDRYPIAKWINNNGFYIGCQPQLTEKEKEYMMEKFDEFFERKDLSKSLNKSEK